jgi:hypothetical protein
MQKDSLIISISEDCGENWLRLYANGPDGNGIFETSESTTSFFEPLSPEDWCGQGYGADCPLIDISAWTGQSNLLIRLESFNNYGNNLFIKNLTISNITDLNDWQNSKTISIFPNPASDYVVLRLPEIDKQSIVSITDFSGRIISEKQISTHEIVIETKDIPNGAYIISVTSGGNTLQKKLLINR